MAIPVFNPGDWLPREYDNGSDTGAMTGFGTFGSTPDEAGVVDTQGAFNPVFNGRTAHPMFEANTDWLARAMPGLARRAQAGDANAAAAYGMFYRDMQDKRGVYSRVFANGLNDRNATAIMNHVFDYASDQTFGVGYGQQFRQRYADYLGNQAKYRGSNADDLFASEAKMDNAVRSSYLSTLDRASTSREMTGFARRAEGNKGILGNVSLELKTALQRWEQETGALRSDEMRTRILGRAAEYFAMAETNPGLRPMLTDTAAMIRGAASDVGATIGDRTPNLFTSYETAMKSLPEYVTFGGSATADAAAGYGADRDTPILSLVRNELATGFAQNIYAGRDAWDFNEDTKAGLRARLSAKLRDSVSPRFRAADPDGSVTAAFVNRLIGDSDTDGLRKQTIDINRALTGVWAPVDQDAAGYRDPAMLQGADRFSDFSKGIVETVIGTRQGNLFGILPAENTTVGSAGVREDQIRASMFYKDGLRLPDGSRIGGISNAVEEELTAMARATGLETMFKDNPGLRDAIKQVTVDYLHNANTVADRAFAGEGNRAEYVEGLNARIGALFAAQELKNRLKDNPEAAEFVSRLDAWRPGVTGEDFEVRGGGDADRRARFSGLDTILSDYVKYVESGASHGDTDRMERLSDVNTYLFAKSALQGLQALLTPTDNGSAVAKGNATKGYDIYAGNGFSAAFQRANSATAAALSKRLMAQGRLATGQNALGIAPDQAPAWQILTEDVTGSSTNPRMAEIGRSYLKSKFASLDLEPQQRAFLEQFYLPAALKVAQDTMSRNPQYGVLPFAANGMIQRSMDELTEPSQMFLLATRLSDANKVRKLQEFEARRVTAAGVDLRKKAADEEGRTTVR